MAHSKQLILLTLFIIPPVSSDQTDFTDSNKILLNSNKIKQTSSPILTSLRGLRNRGRGRGAREARKNEGIGERGEGTLFPLPSPQSPSFFVILIGERGEGTPFPLPSPQSPSFFVASLALLPLFRLRRPLTRSC